MASWFFPCENYIDPSISDVTPIFSTELEIALDTLIDAADIGAISKLLEVNPILLSDSALVVLYLTIVQEDLNEGDETYIQQLQFCLYYIAYTRTYDSVQSCQLFSSVEAGEIPPEAAVIPPLHRISLFTCALTALSPCKADYPLVYAQVCCEAGYAYAEAYDETAEAAYIEEALSQYAAALSLISRDDTPHIWGFIHMRRGIVFMHRQQGMRGENLDQALTDFDHALDTLTSADSPYDWTITRMQRGTLYLEYERGERADNIERAIADFEAALTQVPREGEALPMWGVLHKQLAIAYTERIHDERPRNLQHAVAEYNEALTVFTRDDAPQEYATIQLSLAQIYGELGEEQKVQEAFTGIQQLTADSEKMAQAEAEQADTIVSYQESFDSQEVTDTLEALLAIPDLAAMYNYLVQYQQVLLSDTALGLLRDQLAEIQETDLDGRAEYLLIHLRLLENARKNSIDVAWQHYYSELMPVIEAAILLGTAKSLDEAGHRIMTQQERYTSPAMVAILYRMGLGLHHNNMNGELLQLQTTIRLLKQIRSGQIPVAQLEVQQQTGDVQQNGNSDAQDRSSATSFDFNLSPADLSRINLNEPYWQFFIQELNNLSQEHRAMLIPLFSRISSLHNAADVAAMSTLAKQLISQLDRQKTPYIWAIVHYVVAVGFLANPQANAQEALAHCEEALSVVTRENIPDLWAMLLLVKSCIEMNMVIFKGSSDSNRAEDEQRLQRAMNQLTVAEAFCSQKKVPFEWALVLTTRGIAAIEMENISGNQQYSLEQILADFDAAIPIISKQGTVLQRALPYTYRAIIILRHHEGDRRGNIERVISDCDKAITLCQSPSSHDIAECWAHTLHIRGLAYQERISGGPRENIEQAIKDFERALTVYTRADYPDEWAGVMVNRGHAYMRRVDGNRAQNLEQALDDYTEILAVLATKDDSLEKGAALMNRSYCYMERIREDRTQNQALALEDSNASIALFTRIGRHFERAKALANRATIYMQRLSGDRQYNFKRALEDCNEALGVFTREKTPEWWAKVLVNRGTIHRSLAMTMAFTQRGAGFRTLISRQLSQHPESMTAFLSENAQHFDQALDDFTSALTVLTRESAPMEWATALRERGMTYAVQARGYITGEREQFMRKGIFDLSAALSVLSRYETPHDWAVTTVNRGVLYNELASKQNIEDAELALADMQDGMSVFTIQNAPANYRCIQYIRAEIFEKLENWQAMHDSLMEARRTQRDLAAATFSAQGQADIIAEFAVIDIYTRDVWAMLHLEQPDYAEVAIALEEGRSQIMRAALDLDAAQLNRIRSPEARDRMKAFLSARNQWRKAQHEALPNPTDAARQRNVHKAYTTFIEARDHIRKLDNPDFMAPVPTLQSFSRALHAPDEAVVYLVAGSSLTSGTDGLALIITSNGTGTPTIHHVPLPDLQEFALFDLMEVQAGMAPSLRLSEALESLGPAGLDRVTEQLVAAGIRKVRLIPYSWLGLFPLPSILVLSGKGKRRYMSEVFEEVTVVPSARALEATHGRINISNRQRHELLIAGDPKPLPTDVHPLPYAQAEADTINRIAKQHNYPASQVRYLTSRQVTREHVIEALQHARYAHLALHGEYRTEETLSSRLLLAGNEYISEQERNIYLREALDGVIDLKELRLLVLSACETSITDMQRVPNEMLGLAAGFLQAGAASVIASLWAVDDEATYLLMTRFAQRYLDPQNLWSPARAISEAQRWLREEASNRVLAEYDASIAPTQTSGTRSLRLSHSSVKAKIQTAASRGDPDALPYADPFYWAGFLVTGA